MRVAAGILATLVTVLAAKGAERPQRGHIAISGLEDCLRADSEHESDVDTIEPGATSVPLPLPVLGPFSSPSDARSPLAEPSDPCRPRAPPRRGL